MCFQEKRLYNYGFRTVSMDIRNTLLRFFNCLVDNEYKKRFSVITSGRTSMLYIQLNRRLRHLYNSKKCRSVFGSSGTFSFDIIQVEEQKRTKIYQKKQIIRHFLNCTIFDLLAHKEHVKNTSSKTDQLVTQIINYIDQNITKDIFVCVATKKLIERPLSNLWSVWLIFWGVTAEKMGCLHLSVGCI